MNHLTDLETAFEESGREWGLGLEQRRRFGIHGQALLRSSKGTRFLPEVAAVMARAFASINRRNQAEDRSRLLFHWCWDRQENAHGWRTSRRPNARGRRARFLSFPWAVGEGCGASSATSSLARYSRFAYL